MYFIDHTGHLFNIESYETEPLGYEFNEHPYIFWFNKEYGYKLSVNSYYFKPIRIALPVRSGEVIKKIEITSQDKSIFKLMGPNEIQHILEQAQHIVGNFEIQENHFVRSLTYTPEKTDELMLLPVSDTVSKYYNVPMLRGENDMLYSPDEYEVHTEDDRKYIILEGERIYVNDEYQKVTIKDESLIDENNLYYGHEVYNETQDFVLIPFYCIVNCDKEGVWETNLLIHIETDETDEWCPITVGAEITDECEELIINGRNMGVKLPKQILTAVYGANYHSDYPDERKYAEKLKEYLINFMNIKGQQGNVRSIVDGLKWFEWGDKLNIYHLMKTDNDFQVTYIRDNFDIINDTSIYAFQCFRRATLLSLGLMENIEGEQTWQDYNNNNPWGEMKPVMEDLFDKMVPVVYDETEIAFYKNYFDYSFNELGLKLCALKYYFSKYFLPIHLGLNTVSIEHRCHTNDIKFMVRPKNIINEGIVLTNRGNVDTTKYKIVFPTTDIQYFQQETHFIDGNYCEFGNTYKRGNTFDNVTVYYVNDTLVSIPIKFINDENTTEQLYKCILILTKSGETVHECNFQFVQKTGLENRETWFKNFVIHPKTINTVLTGSVDEKYNINYWVDDDYVLYLCVNNIWYTYKFSIRMPELMIDFGRLEYQYYLDAKPEYTDNYERPTFFKQISGFDVDENGYDFVKFNAFMFQPDLVSMNNSNFIEEITSYADSGNSVSLDDEPISKNLQLGDYYYYILYDGVKYIFSKDTTKIIRETADNIMEVVDNDKFMIKYMGNGTYKMYFKDTSDEHANYVVSGLTLHSKLYENLQSYLSKYCEMQTNIIDNKYQNQIHLINLYSESGEKIDYKETSDSIALGSMILGLHELGNDYNKISVYYSSSVNPEYVQIYKNLFSENGDSIFDKPVTACDNIDIEKHPLYLGKLLNTFFNRTKNITYDMYLMHDNEGWYIVMISRDTVDGYVSEDLKFEFPTDINVLHIDRTDNDKITCSYEDPTKPGKEWKRQDAFLKIIIKHVEKRITIDPETGEKTITYETIETLYYLCYNRSDKHILINRLNYKTMNGVNHFDRGDIITCTLVNNSHLPYKLQNGSKWTFTPKSVGSALVKSVHSLTEMAIMSIGDSATKNEAGFYSVTCNYSLDDFATHNMTKTAIIRVNKD